MSWAACPVALVAAVVTLVSGPVAARPRASAAGDVREGAERALKTGRYEDALRLATERARRAPDDNTPVVLAARAEMALGLYQQARSRLARAAERWPDDLVVRRALIGVLETVGDRSALAPLVDRVYDDWNARRVDRTRPEQLIAVAEAVRLDNNWQDANETLRDAVRADPRAPDANITWGRLFLEKHAAGEAEVSFREALKIDPGSPDAHVGLARAILQQRYDVAAAEVELARALAVNPRHAGALAVRAEIAVDAEDYSRAAALIAELRRTNPRDRRAAAVAAARAALLDDDAGYRRERDRWGEVHPSDGAFFAYVAEALNRHRRYEDARAVADEGARAEPGHAGCLAALGTTLLRLGDEEAGLDALRRAWKRDPYDVRTFNLLNLFEKVIPKRYTMVVTAHLRFRVEPAARPAIEAVVAPFLEETYARYVARYGFEPRGPVVFELYGDPAHYAVRTVGLPALGVAGVCFGRVITSQAPTNHAFNWGIVLAHELAHVFAIQLSRSRVPRWFTEGLSELETMRLWPDWQRRDDAALWGALKTGRLPTLVDLSDAFVHAQSPEEANRAYVHSALAVDFLERRFGFARLREALAAYGRGERGAPVLERLAGMPVEALEQAFRADLAARLARFDDQYLPAELLKRPRAEAERDAAAHPKDPRAQVVAGLAALAAGDRKAAEAARARAVRLPAGSDEDRAALLFLAAELALADRDAERARKELEALLALGPRFDGYDVQVRLALIAVRRKDPAAAETHLRRAITFDPERVEPRALQVELLRDTGRDGERLDALEQTFRLEPQSAALAKELVFGAGRAGRSGKVLALAPAALFIDPADPELHAALGRAQAATGHTAAATATLERALLFGPDKPGDIHRLLVELYTRLGDNKKAAQHRTAR